LSGTTCNAIGTNLGHLQRRLTLNARRDAQRQRAHFAACGSVHVDLEAWQQRASMPNVIHGLRGRARR
jgi:hypothetical protein